MVRNRCRRGHGDLFALSRALFVDLERDAGFEDEGVLQARVAKVLGEPLVFRELPVFAVNGDEIFARTRLSIRVSSSMLA